MDYLLCLSGVSPSHCLPARPLVPHLKALKDAFLPTDHEVFSPDLGNSCSRTSLIISVVNLLLSRTPANRRRAKVGIVRPEDWPGFQLLIVDSICGLAPIYNYKGICITRPLRYLIYFIRHHPLYQKPIVSSKELLASTTSLTTVSIAFSSVQGLMMNDLREAIGGP